MGRPKKENSKKTYEVMDKDDIEAKDGVLNQTIKELNKKYGDMTVMKLSDSSANIQSVSTGILTLDIATGIFGWPKGRIIELYGPESGGKTSTALCAIASFQRNGKKCVYIDAENALDPHMATTLGVDLDDLVFAQPNCAEDALDIVEKFVQSGTTDLIVIDSIASLAPRAEIDGEMDGQTIGLQARILSKFFRKIAGLLNQMGTTLICINQLREKVGIMFGNPETTPGGRALKFYSSIRVEVRSPKGNTIKLGNESIGTKINFTIVKNKVSKPGEKGEYELYFDEGIKEENTIIDWAVDTDIITKSGAWFKLSDSLRFQGKDSLKDYFVEHRDLYNQIKKKIFVLKGITIPKDLEDVPEYDSTLSSISDLNDNDLENSEN